MRTFVDSSAFLAILNDNDLDHHSAAAEWRRLLSDSADLSTSNYAVLETAAVVQRRFGMAGVRALVLDLVPSVAIHWVSPELHEAGTSALLVAGRRDLSLVDCVSFELMRKLGIDVAFTLDRHFQEQGFRCTPIASAA